MSFKAIFFSTTLHDYEAEWADFSDFQVTEYCSGDTPVHVQLLKHTHYKNPYAMQPPTIISKVHKGNIEVFSSSNIRSCCLLIGD